MDRTGYRPPYMYEPRCAPNYRPPVPRAEAPCPRPPRFCPPRPGGPPRQFYPPGRQPPPYNGMNQSIGNSDEGWLQKADTRRHDYEDPGGGEPVPGWCGDTRRHDYNSANEHDRARIPYTEVNRSRPASGTQVDNRNTWQHQHNCRTSNNSNNAPAMCPKDLHSMPNMAMAPPLPQSPNMAMVPPPTPNMAPPLPNMAASPNMAVPPPSPNVTVPPPSMMPPHVPCVYPCPPQTTGLAQPTQSAFLQRPPPDNCTVAPPDAHIPHPPITQYSFTGGHPQEPAPLLNTTIGSPHPAVSGMYGASQGPNGIPELGPQGCDKDQPHEDQVWVTHWLRQHQHFRRRKTKSQPRITVSLNQLVCLSN